MTIALPTAKRLCSVREFTLVQHSRARMVRTLTDTALRNDIGRARDLRDKFKDLARSQRREQRGKVRARGRRAADGNDRTVAKETLFTEVLAALMSEAKRRKQTGATAKKGTKTNAERSTRKASKPKAKASAKGEKKTKSKAQSKAKTTTRGKAKVKTPAKSKATTKAKAKTKTKPQPKPAAARTKTSRAAATSAQPKTTAKKRPSSDASSESAQMPAPSSAPQSHPDPRSEPVSDVNRPIPALTRRGQSLLAHDQRHIQGVKRIPRAQRRARYGHVSALGRRNQARRDSHG